MLPVSAPPGAGDGDVQRLVDRVSRLELVDEPVDEMDGVVHPEPDRHREDRGVDRRQRDVEQPHRPHEQPDRDEHGHEVEEPVHGFPLR